VSDLAVLLLTTLLSNLDELHKVSDESSANQCILGNVYLRSNLPRKVSDENIIAAVKANFEILHR